MLRDRRVKMNSVKAVVAAFNQEKALVGAFSVITNLRMDLFKALFFSDAAGQKFNFGKRTSHKDAAPMLLVFPDSDPDYDYDYADVK